MSKRRRRNNNRARTKKINKKITSVIISIIVLLILAMIGTSDEVLNKINESTGLNINFNNTQEEENLADNSKSNVEFTGTTNLEVYFIDVGQADSILILNGNESMLIDAGNNEDGDDVVDFIKSKGIEKINYLIRNTSTRRSYRRIR